MSGSAAPAAAVRMPAVASGPIARRCIGGPGWAIPAHGPPRIICRRLKRKADGLRPRAAPAGGNRGGSGGVIPGKSLWQLIMEEISLERKATLVELPVFFGQDRPEKSFDFERWEKHKSSSRYGRLPLGLLFSITTRRVVVVVALLTAWSIAVGSYNAVAAEHQGWPELALPLEPFELTAPVLGLLLVFRTNSAYERFDLGNSSTWEVRNLVRHLVVYSTAAATPSAEKAAAWELVDAFLLLHSWMMTSYLKGAPNSGQQAAVLRAALGQQEEVRRLATGGLSFWALSASVSLAMARRLPGMAEGERLMAEERLSALTLSLGSCERLLRTPIPLGYTRYSVRFLWIWLTLLPLALARTFDSFGLGTWWEDKPQPLLPLAMLFIGFIFLSIEDIAVQIEEPFAILPLRQHQKWLIKDVRQLQAVVTAYADDCGTVGASVDGADNTDADGVAGIGDIVPLAKRRQRQAAKYLLARSVRTLRESGANGSGTDNP
eukprot:jgi/Tetstr1/459728/TSEL_005081.t1